MGRIAGTFYLKVNNKLLYSTGDFKFSPGIPKREAVHSSFGFAGYKEEPTTAFIEGELLDTGLDHGELLNLTSGTITLELANGNTFVLSEAYCCGDITISTDGKLNIKFEGSKGEIING